VAGGIGLDDLCLGDLEHARWCLARDGLGHGSVNHPHGILGQVAGHHRDLPGHPRFRGQVEDLGPHRGEPVLQVEHVGGDRAGGQGVHAAGDAELDEGEVLHTGGAVAAEDVEPVATGHARAGLVAGIGGVQSGPVGDELEVFGLDHPTTPQAVLELAQRAPGVEGVGDRDHGSFYRTYVRIVKVWYASCAPAPLPGVPFRVRQLGDPAHPCADERARPLLARIAAPLAAARSLGMSRGLALALKAWLLRSRAWGHPAPTTWGPGQRSARASHDAVVAARGGWARPR